MLVSHYFRAILLFQVSEETSLVWIENVGYKIYCVCLIFYVVFISHRFPSVCGSQFSGWVKGGQHADVWRFCLGCAAAVSDALTIISV